jgi:hypothetical protein
MWMRSQSVKEMWLFPARYEPAAPGETLVGSATGWKFVSMVGSGDGRLVWFDAKQFDRHVEPIGTAAVADGYGQLIGTQTLPRGLGSLASAHGKSRAHRVSVPWSVRLLRTALVRQRFVVAAGNRCRNTARRQSFLWAEAGEMPTG